jgi:hypothetical protein
VCYQPLVGSADIADLPPEIQDKVYRPGRDGLVEDVTLQFPERVTSYSGGDWELVENEDEGNDE